MKPGGAGLPTELPSWPDGGIETCECHFEERLVLGEFDDYLKAAVEQRLAELDGVPGRDNDADDEGFER